MQEAATFGGEVTLVQKPGVLEEGSKISPEQEYLARLALSQAKTPDQQTLNQTKMLDTAQKVLQVNPCNLRTLAVLAYTKRALAEAGQPVRQVRLPARP